MKTNVAESSVAAYYEVAIKRLPAQQKRTAKAMKGKGWLSRRQVAALTGIETSTVSARINAMVAAGLVEESEQLARCPITNIHVKHIRETVSER